MKMRMKMRMNNAAIKAYEVEDGPIKKIVINIDIDELDKHPEILGQETTNGLKILNLIKLYYMAVVQEEMLDSEVMLIYA